MILQRASDSEADNMMEQIAGEKHASDAINLHLLSWNPFIVCRFNENL